MAARIPNSVELQSLRGLAALVVLFHHMLRAVRAGPEAAFVADTLLNAHAAVVLFFVLSGYVLSRSLSDRGMDAHGLFGFYLRRAFRIYPALWVAAACGLLYMIVLQPVDAPWMTPDAARRMAADGLSAGAVAASLLGFGNALVPPAWTVTVELAASLLLPAIVLTMRRGPGTGLAVVGALAAASLVAGVGARQLPLYLVDFALGALLAQDRVRARIRVGRGATVAAAIVLVGFRMPSPWPYHAAWPSLVEGVAATLLIAGVAAGHATGLRRPALVRLGDWSFGVYLLHIPIGYGLIRGAGAAGWGAPGLGPALALAVATAAVTIPAAALLHRFVERPGIALGRRVLAGAALHRVALRPAR